jgi:hypothetical protein
MKVVNNLAPETFKAQRAHRLFSRKHNKAKNNKVKEKINGHQHNRHCLAFFSPGQRDNGGNYNL